MSLVKDIQIPCADGFSLTGTLFESQQGKASVMMAPATGIRRTFYFSFAQFLSEQGYHVLTFENRGIGDSGGDALNAVNASLINWGRLDMQGVLEKLKQLYPDTSYHLIGHSAGGQLVGLMDGAPDLKSMLAVASSSGSLRHMPYPFKISAFFFLNGFIPINNLFFNRTNAQWLGMGEPLPKRVAAEWRRWCNGRGYVETAFGKSVTAHQYHQIDFPSLWLHATDDDIACKENVQDMIRVFPKSKAEVLALDPKTFGYEDIGHMKFFSSKRKAIWKFALDWLDTH